MMATGSSTMKNGAVRRAARVRIGLVPAPQAEPVARELTSGLQRAPGLRARTYDTAEDARTALRRAELDAVVVVPPALDADVRTASPIVVRSETVNGQSDYLPLDCSYSTPTMLVLFVFINALARGAAIVQTRRTGVYARALTAPVSARPWCSAKRSRICCWPSCNLC